MAAPTIPNLPTAPAPTDPANVFNSRAFAWVAALTGWTTAVNALVAWLNANVGSYVVEARADSETTLVEADAGKYLRFTNSGAKYCIVSSSISGNFVFNLRNAGSGDLTLVESGVTINVPAGGSLVIAQGGTASLVRVATDEFDLIGQTVAP
jgi:hypothetical protein